MQPQNPFPYAATPSWASPTAHSLAPSGSFAPTLRTLHSTRALAISVFPGRLPQIRAASKSPSLGVKRDRGSVAALALLRQFSLKDLDGHELFWFRATAGYCFSSLFGFLRASRNFAALHPCELQARGGKGDRGISPCKTRLSKSLGFKSPPLRQISLSPTSS